MQEPKFELSLAGFLTTPPLENVFLQIRYKIPREHAQHMTNTRIKSIIIISSDPLIVLMHPSPYV